MKFNKLFIVFVIPLFLCACSLYFNKTGSFSINATEILNYVRNADTGNARNNGDARNTGGGYDGTYSLKISVDRSVLYPPKDPIIKHEIPDERTFLTQDFITIDNLYIGETVTITVEVFKDDERCYYTEPTKVVIGAINTTTSIDLIADNGSGSDENESDMVFVEGSLDGMIDGFYICKHEVTQKEFMDIMGKNYASYENPSLDKGENRPVENVRWYEAIVYCNLRSMAEELTPCYSIIVDGHIETNPSEWGDIPTSPTDDPWTITPNTAANGYRLPILVEWQHAATFGATSLNYTEPEFDKIAWYNGNSKPAGEVSAVTSVVCLKNKNALGLFDMFGNVEEWCWNVGTEQEKRIAVGGGVADEYDKFPMNDYRSYSPYLQHYPVGFRVVRTKLQ